MKTDKQADEKQASKQKIIRKVHRSYTLLEPLAQS